MIKRTSLNLDLELVSEARTVLHTRATTETVHEALREVVRRDRRRRLAARDFSLLTPEVIGELRRPRS